MEWRCVHLWRSNRYRSSEESRSQTGVLFAELVSLDPRDASDMDRQYKEQQGSAKTTMLEECLRKGPSVFMFMDTL